MALHLALPSALPRSSKLRSLRDRFRGLGCLLRFGRFFLFLQSQPDLLPLLDAKGAGASQSNAETMQNTILYVYFV